MTSVATSTANTADDAVWRRISPRFWVCVAILVAAAVGMQMVETVFKVWFRKEALPLKRSLRLFDAQALGPRYVRDPETDRIAAPTDDMIESLGTSEFLQIFLADTQQTPQAPGRLAHVLVTYYTGQPDKVPHVPDECWSAAGAQPLGAETVRVRVAGVGAPDDEVPVRMVRFLPPGRAASGGAASATVLYFFHTNGVYATTRDEVRWALSKDLFQRYAYYAKIEVTFSDGAGRRAEAETAREALAPLLERLLPVLLRDYIDLERFTAGGEPAARPD